MTHSCTFCAIGAGGDGIRTTREDVIWRDERTTAFVAAKWWKGNEGHVLVIPNRHARDLYEIDEGDLAAVYATAKRVAAAIRATYGCEGTSTRQHNEPGGGQDVFHFHVHVFPRWEGDPPVRAGRRDALDRGGRARTVRAAPPHRARCSREPAT